MISYRTADYEDYESLAEGREKADAMMSSDAYGYVENIAKGWPHKIPRDPNILHRIVTDAGMIHDSFFLLALEWKDMLPETLRHMWDNSDYKEPRKVLTKILNHPNTPKDVKAEIQEALDDL